jgi:hypothetical protein
VSSPRPVVLLGAQRFDPTLGDAVAALGVTGRVAIITAGWQEREAEDHQLVDHLGGRAVNLALHARGEAVFRDDPALRDAHREHHAALRHRQDFYRIRLEHLLEADRVIAQREAPPEIQHEQSEASCDAIVDLDRWHLGLCRRLRAEFDARWALDTRPVVAQHRAELAALVADCDAVAIAGGHVATLVNRLRLFGLGDLVADKTVFAWSAGAMAVSERIVLFHDDPPQGTEVTEVLDAGLGLARNVVVFPEPERRLHLDDPARIARLARRFAPAHCLAFPARAWVCWHDGAACPTAKGQGVVALRTDGTHGPFDASAEAAP